MAGQKTESEANRSHSNRVDHGLHSAVFGNLISIDELVVELRGKVKKSTIHSWLRQGLPSRLIMRRRFFNPSEVKQWLERFNE